MDALEAGIVLVAGGQLVPECGFLADLGAKALAHELQKSAILLQALWHLFPGARV